MKVESTHHAKSSHALSTLPVVVVILSMISPWEQEFWVRTVDMTVQFIAPATMLFLIWPSR